MDAVIAVSVILSIVYLFCGMAAVCMMDDANLIKHRWVIVMVFLLWPPILIALFAGYLFAPVVDMWKDLGRKR